MATNEQRARRRAQRETAQAVRNKTTGRLPAGVIKATRDARIKYANDVLRGREPMPAMGTREARNLASLAGKARWGKADPAFEKAFAGLWYHKQESTSAEEDAMDEDERDKSED